MRQTEKLMEEKDDRNEAFLEFDERFRVASGGTLGQM